MPLWGIDFETHKIEQRPAYPPKPVGVAIHGPGTSCYMAWGHPTGNNSSISEAKSVLKKMIKSGDEMVFHHCAFDIAVMDRWMGLRPDKYHDTMFLAFLNDPREENLSLKPLSDKYLGMPPEEQDRLRDWIIANIYGGKTDTKANPWGAHIAEAPGNIVSPYAIGDVVRTVKLFKYLYPIIKKRGMEDAYRRELKVMPLFNRASDEGLKVAHNKLAKDLKVWRAGQAERAEWIRKRLKQPKSFNEISPKGELISTGISSSQKLADAMDKAGKVSHWIMTPPSKNFPRGQRSTKRDNLIEVCTDKQLVAMLSKFGVFETYINTFAIPWVDSGGRVHPSFNQVRSSERGKVEGTRTGRPSSFNPNFLNIPRNQEDPELPNMRNYIIPDDGMIMLIRDYNQQELRIAAHFEQRELCAAYLQDPRTDAHDLVKGLIYTAVGIEYPRSPVKVVNFGVIYGMGVDGTARKIKGSYQEAAELKAAHKQALPGIYDLMKRTSRASKKGAPIVTWGGREYYAEEPAVVKGQKRDFHYKQLNYLIQGSAADATKEAMIRAAAALKPSSRICLQVYDEIIVQCDKGDYKKEMKNLKDAMESLEFRVLMLSDGKLGRKSWGEAVKYKD